jgi:arylsulfatase A-like enzyme
MIPTFLNDPDAMANLIALYDSEINYVDSYIGEVIKRLELEENSLIIITSDHGEEFLEHGELGHGNNLYQETIQVPLIVKLPNSSKKKFVTYRVNLVDIMPTILNMLEITPPPQVAGESLWERGKPLSWLRRVFSQKPLTKYEYAELDTGSILKTIITPQWKYIFNFQTTKAQLYNITSDPLELNNLVEKEPVRAAQLKNKLLHWAESSKQYPVKKKSIQRNLDMKKKLDTLTGG